MSGIFAVFNLDGSPVDPELLKTMAKAAEHRGPDGIFFWIEGPLGIGQLWLHTTSESIQENRLITSHDRRYTMAVDARIDNRKETIDLLASKGTFLPGDLSDEELILHAYIHWKEETPRHLIGDFAFLIWDNEEKTLFCARDSLGIKQLYFSQMGQTLVVATELAQVLAHSSVRRDLDEIFIGNFLVFNWIEPERTMFAHIQAVPAAHYLLAKSDGVRHIRYWDSPDRTEIRYKNDDEYAEQFREVLSRAIQDRLRTTSDTVGILLSGGLDSASVASIIQKKLSLKPGTPRLKAYSILYDNFPAADERDLIRTAERELALDVQYFQANDFWLLRDPNAYQPSLETPAMGIEELALKINSKMKSAGIEVFLTGQGGDHLTTGSPQVYLDRFKRLDMGIWNELSEHARSMEKPSIRLAYQYLFRPLAPEWLISASRRLRRKRTHDSYPEWLRSDFITKHHLAEREKQGKKERDFHSLARTAMKRQIDAIPFFTSYQDRSASRSSLDARHPFLDRRLVEFVMQIPPDQHYRAGWHKTLLRRAMKDILPEPIRGRQGKATMSDFYHSSLREKEIDQIKSLFKYPILGIMGIVNPIALQDAYVSYCSEYDNERLGEIWIATNPWRIICLELWLKQYSGIIK